MVLGKGSQIVLRQFLLAVAVSAASTGILTGSVRAQPPVRPAAPPGQEAGQEGPVPEETSPPSNEAPSVAITMIAGRPFVRVTLVHGETRILAHLRLDVGRPIEMTLHPRTARLLGMDRDSTVDVAFGDWIARDLHPVFTAAGELGYLTAEYATELSEIPVVGIVGSLAFVDRRVRIDYEARRLTLLEKRIDVAAPGAMPDAAPPASAGFVTLPCRVRDGAYSFAIDVGADEPLTAAVSTMEVDSWVDAGTAERRGHPGGDFPVAKTVVDGVAIDVAKHVALRPGKAPSEFPGRPGILLGSNFFEHFVVTFDPHRSVIELERVRPAKAPTVERAILVALAARDVAAIEKWAEKNKTNRLAMDAGRTLLSMRIHESPLDAARIEKALAIYTDTTPLKRRTRMLLEFLQKMAADREDVYAIARSKTIELAVKFARHDEDPDVIHKTRSELGARFLEEGNLKEAHRHLLSAAFGLPRDGQINLRLGRFWEQKGSNTRAWSRFLMAAVTPEAGADGMAGLKRLADKTGDRSPYDAEEMERLLEGRVPGFGPASTYRAPDGKRPSRTLLAELYTGAHCRPCAAADLAFDGISAHFRNGEVVVLEHHLPIPAVEPLVAPAALERAKRFGVRGTPSVVIDGVEVVRGMGGRVDDAADRFRTLRTALEGRLERATPWRLAIEGTVNDGVLAVSATVEGPGESGVRLRLYVAERTMLFPGGSKIVLHRWVTRHDLSAGGVPIAAKEGKHTVERRVELDAILEEVDAYLDTIEDRTNKMFPMRPDEVSERQLTVIGFLERASGEVLQAARWERSPREDE